MSSSIAVTRGTNDKPASSRALVEVLNNGVNFGGQLLIGFPIIGGSEGRLRIDALLVSEEKGIVIFDLIEGTNPGAYGQRQDDSYNKLEARLKTHRELLDRRQLLVDIYTISFAPGIPDPRKHIDGQYPIANTSTLVQELNNFQWSNQRADIYDSVLSAIQNISTIRKARTRRLVSQENSRGARLKRLEDSIATLDNMQSKAVIETVDGVQRIRGLAGSGKTIVLALKAAYFQAQHPEWKIAVTFNTRSLKGHFRRLINNFSVEQTGEEPDWENLRILNAWGAPGSSERDGIYHEFCRLHEIEYLDFGSAKEAFGQERAFAGACERAIEQARTPKPIYDAILVDEAQDFPPAFLLLCYQFLKQHKRLVYAYDELQNLGGESLPSPEEIFGKHADGSPKVRFEATNRDDPQQDIILEKCYRNSRPLLVTAHSLGFGIYREPPPRRSTGLVQMFDHPQLWEEIGYRLKDGELKAGSSVTLYRTADTSPSFLEEHSPIDDLIRFQKFDSEEEQAQWLIKAIKRNLEDDELRHDDIVVINPEPLSTRKKVGPIRKALLEVGISSHIAGVDTDPDIFFQSDDAASVTFTGVFRAKGNEAGMVYIINAQDCNSSSWNLATIRNRLFTAITRSKAWVRVYGVGDEMKALMSEYQRLKQREFELTFTYPTKEQREQLKIVHRDMTTLERTRVKTREKDLLGLIDDLESGSVHPEDLDEDLLAKLKGLLTKTR